MTTHLAEHDQRRRLIEALHPCRPIRRAVPVRIHRQIDGPRRIGRVVRERLVLLYCIIQQAMELVHPGPRTHERGDASGRNTAEALQRGGEAEQVVRGGEEEEEEQCGEREQENCSAAAS
jgi:hypothetical protein